MKIGKLTDDNGNLSPLYSALKFIVYDGKKEEISLAYGRISNLQNVDFLFSNNLLYGERNFLRAISDFIVDGEKIVRSAESYYFNCEGAELCIGNSEISSATIFGDEVIFFYPFPFRDNSISRLIIFEILDYDVFKEAHRVMKRNGKLKIIIRDIQHGGLHIKDVLKFIIKFKIEKISWNRGFWIIEAKKIK